MLVKKCGCCGKTYTKREWLRLPLVGHQHVPADEHGEAMNLEYRNCPCGNTIAVDYHEHPAVPGEGRDHGRRLL